jgi:VCBS repeat-containing protein
MLADYQARANGGEGWLRILRFVPADNRVYVRTYSPWLNRYETDADSEFQLDFPMAGPFAHLGSVTVPSGGTATFTPTGLQPGTTYEWQVTATNASGRSTTGPTWRFTTSPTQTPGNTAPVAGAEAYFVQSDTMLSISAPGVLANDTDAEGTSLTAQLVSSVAHGTLSLSANGGFVYTPAPGYTGPDAFAYRASDGQATSASATVAITVTPPPSSSLPGPWLTRDVGAVAQPGSASYSSGVFTVSGSGANIWGTADGFRYVYQSTTGDVQITAHVPQVVQGTSAYAKVGVMLRESAAPNAAHVMLSVRPNGSLEYMTRSSTGGQTTFLGTATQPAPTWLRLSRSGSTVTAFVSANGSSWNQVGIPRTIGFSSTAMAGLIVCAASSALNTAAFENVTLSTPASPPLPTLPSQWQTADVGAVAQAGSASYANGVFTVRGSGANIWGTSDGFRYVYQSTSGDTQITARVPQQVQATSTYAKVGVMLRESTAAGSGHVILSVRPNGSLEFMTRSSTGGQTTFVATATQPEPTWLRLTRTGTTVTAWRSANGSSWTQVGPSVSFSSTSLGGLIVCANSSALNTATFDNVTVSGPT